MNLASSEVSAATDAGQAITENRRQNPGPAQTDGRSDTSAGSVVVSEEMLQASVIVPFQKAADSKIAGKEADVQTQLQNQAKLSAVHAAVREKCTRDTTGECGPASRKLPSLLSIPPLLGAMCRVALMPVCSCIARAAAIERMLSAYHVAAD